jgi:hypothetical protein
MEVSEGHALVLHYVQRFIIATRVVQMKPFRTAAIQYATAIDQGRAAD